MTKMRARTRGEKAAENEVLLRTARVILPREEADRLSALSEEGLDWDYLLEQARTHGVAPLLAWNMQSLGGNVVSASVFAQLRGELQDNAIRNLLLTRELVDLLDLLKDKSIPALPFKGPTLAQSAYGNLALRSFGDLDILVHPRDAKRARQLLAERGYRAPERWTARHKALSIDTLGQLPLQRGAGVRVELHTSLFPRAFGFRLEMNDLWHRRRTMDLLGRKICALAPEDLLLLLCAHGSKHQWNKLMWVCDVAELLRSEQELSWESVFQRARQLRGERMLFLGLALTERLINSALPADCADRADARSAVRRLTSEVEYGMLQSDDRPESVLSSCFFYLRVREKIRDGLRYCASMAFTPTESDWLAVPRDLPVTGLYYVIRPLRLAAKYAVEVGRKLGMITG